MNNSKSNQELKIGDIVRLKSSGPKMTVTRCDVAKNIKCTWFLEGKPEVGYFPPDSLEKQ